MRLSLNLQKKAVLMIAGILFFTIAINTAVLTLVATGKYRNAIFSKTEAVGEGLQRDLGKVLGLGVPIESLEGASEKMKEFVSRDKAIGYAMVMDTTGKILFHNDAASIGKELKDKAATAALASNKMLVQAVDSFYDISFPLLNAEGKMAGTLRVGIRTEAINSQLYTLLFWAIGVSLLCFVLALALVSVSISKFITRPITVMEKTADRIASGDLTATIDIKGRDEIASLGEAINRMAFN